MGGANNPYPTEECANDPNARDQQWVVLMIPSPPRSVLMILMSLGWNSMGDVLMILMRGQQWVVLMIPSRPGSVLMILTREVNSGWC